MIVVALVGVGVPVCVWVGGTRTAVCVWAAAAVCAMILSTELDSGVDGAGEGTRTGEAQLKMTSPKTSPRVMRRSIRLFNLPPLVGDRFLL